MKRLLFAFLGLIFLLPVSVLAQKPVEIMPVEPGFDRGQPFIGQDHTYSVTLRGNGEAVVGLKVLFSNTQDGSQSSLSFDVPKIFPQEIIAFQVTKPQRCIRYEPLSYGNSDFSEKNCAEYAQDTGYSYGWGNNYQKVDAQYSDGKINIKLATPIESNKTGSLLLRYRGFGYASKNLFGAFKYEFESLSVDSSVNQMIVAVKTDSDLFIKGAKGQVKYQGGIESISSDAVPMGEARANSQLDTYYNSLGQGSVYKHASNLAPRETYKLSGTYSMSWIRLYALEIVAVVLVVALALAALIFSAKLLFGLTIKAKSIGANILIIKAVSFVSSVGIALYTGFIYMVLERNWLIRGSWGGLMALMILITSAAIYGLLGLLPAVLVGLKRGWGWGIATAIATVLWMIFYLVIFAIISLAGGSTSVNY
jgi:hypothetical protein